MKKLLYSVAAMALAFFAASCQQENLEPAAGNNKVTYTVQVDGAVATKAIGDETTAVDKVYYEVYRANADGELVGGLVYEGEETVTGGAASFELEFVKNQNFVVLFWAQDEDLQMFDIGDLRAVELKNPGLSNNVNAQVFAGKDVVTNCASAVGGNVKLTRPISQLNIVTNEESLKFGTKEIEIQKSYVKVTGLYPKYNVYNKEVSEGPTSFTYEMADVLKNAEGKLEKLSVNGDTYYYVAMNYVGFAPLTDNANGATVDVELDIITSESPEGNPVHHDIPNVPVKQNYRTNIVGNLLTAATDYNVTLSNNWSTPEEQVYVWNGSEISEPAKNSENIYEISKASELAWLAAAVNGALPETKAAIPAKSFIGETFVLTNDIDLGGKEWTPISMSTDLADGKTFRGTFDGQGHTITGLKCNNNEVAALFGYVYACTIKNVTVDGASISGNHYAAGLVGWVLNNDGNIKVPFALENCHVKNSTIASTPELVNGEWDNGDKVGGLVGYAVFTGNAEAKISGCSVENTTVKAYRDFAGLVGYAKDVTLKSCTFTNLTLEQDLTHDYKTPNTPTTFGEYIGRSEGGNTIDGNFYAASAAEFQAIVNGATDDVTIVFGANIEGNVTVVQKQGVKITVDGKDKKYNGTIKVHSNSEHYADAALTIKNVGFETSTTYPDKDGDPYFNFIEALENGSERYSTNITVEDCTFNAIGDAVNVAVGLQIKSSKKAKVIGCTATNMHSLIQAQSCDETVVVNGCTINGKNGVAFKQVKAATVEGTTITATGYGIRFDGNTDNYGITVKDNNVEAVQPLIVRKMTGQNNTITLEGTNTLTTEAEYQIVITNDSDDKPYVKPTGTYTLTGADAFSVYPPVPVAKIGDTEYTSIDDAIAAWTNGTTLTLLGNVTLGDAIKLNSNEYHILDLGTFTMTAASKMNAIEIVNTNLEKATYALDIKADANNPGGITAKGKAIVRTTGNKVKDRPIIRFYNGVFTGTNIIYHNLNNGASSPYFYFYDGVYNGTVYANRATVHFYGGTFNNALQISVDSSAYGLIAGGRFKSMNNMMGSDISTGNKFTIGSSKGVYDRGIYVDDEGYYVVCKTVITDYDTLEESGIVFEARKILSGGTLDYLTYSSAATNGLYYTKASLAGSGSNIEYPEK